MIRDRAATPRNPPEAETVMAVQAQMPFQILIPAYMPSKFNRGEVKITLNELGPGGEPMVQMAYQDRRGGTLFVRQWVPINPEKEILAGSRPVETKWGQAWLLKQGESLVAIWADVGPLRVSIYSPFQNMVTPEEILQMVETLGPASNQQVFSFVVDLPELRSVEPPPPFEVPLNEEGVQEFTLVVTPGGYDPLRFKVKQGVPVRMHFRAIGQVGCGKELIFPVNSSQTEELILETDKDTGMLEFLPDEAGTYSFNCSHQMYRGVMTVAP
ncbi:MAG: cupredoxin domain-containing protein [Chloroflexi bacterium]|nr:cupredoxin domain-containing protein [Chloroflexota bacterium]